jgi:hypothetical protein
MKNLSKIVVLVMVLTNMNLFSQKSQRDLDNYRNPDKRGINIFEAPKDSVSTPFNGVYVRMGGASTLQFQSISHSNSGAIALKEIGGNFNLATANLDMDVVLAEGLRMHLRTYLSSRHHPEPYVKGGYLQIDKLDFIKKDFLGDFMQYATIKIGHMENNYGDAHFRRSDNAQTLYNPFVGNLIMDAFTTEVGAEFYYRRNGFVSMIGFTNGKLNQDVANPDTGGASFLAKFGYDKQVNDDFRWRLTGSLYNTGKVRTSYLYSADRAGSRYYLVLEPTTATPSANFRSGRYNPNLTNQISAIMINPFVKYKGLEFFGTYENATGKAAAETDNRTATQWALESIYRFGKDENLYIGARYNTVDSEEMNGDNIEISRFNLAAGWFMTRNVMLKMEYVTQKHSGYRPTSIFNGGKFDGFMLESVISF